MSQSGQLGVPTEGDPEAETYTQYHFRLPEGATDVLLVRHGESAPMGPTGFPKTAAGQADPPLSPTGQQQAKAVSARLAEVGLDALYVSSLRRTHETIAPLVEATGLQPTVVDDFREVYLGEWEGGEFRRRAIIKDPRMMQLLAGGSWGLVPGAEPPDEFAARVRRALENIHTAHPGQRVAVVCHGGVIGQALALASGSNALAFMSCDNTSISQLVLSGNTWIVRRFNDTEHLGPALTRYSPPPE
jgi:probable phosphoglycerate mutase